MLSPAPGTIAGLPIDGTMAEIPAELINDRLRVIGRGNATAAFRALCVLARLCSNCGQSWDNDEGRCACQEPG